MLEHNGAAEAAAERFQEYVKDIEPGLRKKAPHLKRDEAYAIIALGLFMACEEFKEELRELRAAHPVEQRMSEAEDAARLEWLAHHGAALRIDPNNMRWYVHAPYHTRISSVDNVERFESFRAAIDAARKAAARTEGNRSPIDGDRT
jgi:hypothetical protein